MNTQNELARINNLLKENHIEPKRSFGQNFLVDSDSINTIIESFDYTKYNSILEIGPGLGALTIPLSKKNKPIIAIDADRDMVNILNKIFNGNDNVKIINSPFEHWKKKELKKEILIIGNLPYNLTSKLIGYSTKIKAKDLGFMVQKEVADKLEYKVGSKDNNALSCYLALLGNFKKVIDVPKGAFYPIPKVNSTFISLNIQHNIDYSIYLTLKQLFLTPNKTLLNVLTQLIKDKNQLDFIKTKYSKYLNMRARQMTPEELLPLALDLNLYNKESN